MNYNRSVTEKINKIRESLNDDNVRHLSQMLMYRFLSEIEKITDDRNISRKQLAELIGVSPSYITQLYRGNKPLNIETLAKVEKALDFRFDIKAIDSELLEISNIDNMGWDETQIKAFADKYTTDDVNVAYVYYKKPIWANNCPKSNDEHKFTPLKKVPNLSKSIA